MMPGSPYIQDPEDLLTWKKVLPFTIFVPLVCIGTGFLLLNSLGAIIGGILGAGVAISSSRGKDRGWAVPAGGTAGALIGCQVDGG